MKDFLCKHPICTFLIVDTLVCGVVNIVNILAGRGSHVGNDGVIETTFVEDD